MTKNDKTFIIMLIVLLAIAAGWIGFFLTTDSPEPTRTTETALTATDEQTYETCRYGAAMFYVGRGIDPDEAETLAWRDCDKALTDMGQDAFNAFYAPVERR